MRTRRVKVVAPIWAAILVMTQIAGAGGAWGATIPQPPNASPFTLIGFIQKATLDPPGDVLDGGTVTVNGTTVVIPQNTIVQMPNTFLTWAELFRMAPAPWGPTQTGLALADRDPAGKPPLTTYEITLFGNRIVDPADGTDKYVAGLVTIAQESLKHRTGVRQLHRLREGRAANRGDASGGLGDGCPGADQRPRSAASACSHSPDPRFTADTDYATIHAKTGYPMCIPRSDPAVADDPQCPKGNRPLDAGGNPIGNFTTPPQPTPPDTLPAGSADSTKQAPIMVGDFVEYIGTLQEDADGQYVSAFQIIPNVGIYTAPGSDPAYITLETTVLGVGGNPIPGVPQENNNRIVIVGFVTDPSRAVDAYAVEVDPCTGQETERVISTLGSLIPELVPRGRVRFAQLVSNANPPTRNWRLRYADATAQTSANGLVALQYSLPVNEYIFAENTIFGDPTLLAVPLNFQDFPFLTLGSGPWRGPDGPIVGQLKPFPLALIPGMSPAIPTPPVCRPVPTLAPTVQAGTPQTVQAGTIVTLTATGTDPNTPGAAADLHVPADGWPGRGAVRHLRRHRRRPRQRHLHGPDADRRRPLDTQLHRDGEQRNGRESRLHPTFVAVGSAAVLDTVTITAATYDLGRGTLTVNATSSDPAGAAALFLTTDTGLGPIQMSRVIGGTYTFTQRGIFPQPAFVWVVSSEGGKASTFLTLRGPRAADSAEGRRCRRRRCWRLRRGPGFRRPDTRRGLAIGIRRTAPSSDRPGATIR